jgi:parallel beta-helix repeat protein
MHRTAPLQLEHLEARIALSNYYVSPTGTDSGSGSSDAPWRTLQRAANAVVAGDTVTVRAGTYAGFVLGWDFSQDGTADNPIVFQAESGVVINSRNNKTADAINLEGTSYITIDGFTITNPSSGGTITRAGIRTVNGDGVIIRNNSADNAGKWGIFTSHSNYVLIENNITSHSQSEHGIYVSNACTGPIVRRNTVFGNRGAGIHMNGDLSQGGDGLITYALVERNTIFDNGKGGGAAINADGVQNSVFQNNLLYNNHATGIALFRQDGGGGSINNLVLNNTVVMASDARWALNINGGSTGNVVLNNILYNNHPSRGSITISSDSLSGFVSDYNVVMGRFAINEGSVINLAQWNAQTGQDGHSIVATPSELFVDVAGNDYHLKSDSPAIGAGNADQAPGEDLDGNARPGPQGISIGAYEYGY